MKKLLLLLVCALLSSTASFAIVGQANLATTPQFSQAFASQLTLKQQLTLKVANKAVKKAQESNSPAAADISKGVYILLAFIGLGWLAMGLLDDWSGNSWIICLVLTAVLPWIGGFIYSMIKMKDYF